MPSSGDYTFRILSGGEALEEYEVESKADVNSCWIASEAGKNFSIEWKGIDRGASLRCTVSMDGNIVKSYVHVAGSVMYYLLEGCAIDTTTLKLFAFSEVSLTDDEAIASLDQNLADLGTIEISLYRISVNKPAGEIFSLPSHLKESAIHERSKKMSMHRATFQGTKKTTTQSYHTTLLETAPHARFVFKYRPKAFLRAQGLAPDDEVENRAPNDEALSRSNTPAPKKGKRKRDLAANAENEEEEERKEREILKTRQQMHELQAKLNQLERGRSGGIKREVKCEPFASLPVDNNGVIDLTED